MEDSFGPRYELDKEGMSFKWWCFEGVRSKLQDSLALGACLRSKACWLKDSLTLGTFKGGLVFTCKVYKLDVKVQLRRPTQPKDLMD